jgi:hypothetical protein
MATSVTSQTTTQLNSSTIGQTKTSFLNRCVEDFSPDKVANFEKKTTQWNIISIVSTVAFFALAIGAFIATSILTPAYVPVAGIAAILLAIPAVQQIKKFQDWSRAAQNEADKYKAIQSNYADLTGRTPQELQRILLQMGIIWSNISGMEIQHPENLSRLNPLLAQAKYLEKQTRHWMILRDRYVNEANQLPTSPDARQESRHGALGCEDEAVKLKIENAFIYAVLLNPNFKGTLEDVATLSKIDYTDRALGNALNDPTVNQILTFNNRNLAPITFDDIKTASVADLGRRIFAAMAA